MAKHAHPSELDTWFCFVGTENPNLSENVVTIIRHDGTHEFGKSGDFDWSLPRDHDKAIDYYHFGEIVW